jgi:hypothetical protein
LRLTFEAKYINFLNFIDSISSWVRGEVCPSGEKCNELALELLIDFTINIFIERF